MNEAPTRALAPFRLLIVLLAVAMVTVLQVEADSMAPASLGMPGQDVGAGIASLAANFTAELELDDEPAAATEPIPHLWHARCPRPVLRLLSPARDAVLEGYSRQNQTEINLVASLEFERQPTEAVGAALGLLYRR